MDKVDLLLDTDVLVDLLRRFPPAVRWAKDHAEPSALVAGVDDLHPWSTTG